MVAISVGLALAFIGLGILGMLFAGIRSMIQGNQDLKRIGMMAVPFIVFGISYGVLGEFAKAGILTTLVMMGGMILAIALTGLRGTFKI